MSFWDLRKNSCIPVGPDPHFSHTTGNGFLQVDMQYTALYGTAKIPHAIYTHKWSPSGTKLMIGGGPIMVFISTPLQAD